MERFVIIANGWKPLTIITMHSILDIAAALDPPLVFDNIYMKIKTMYFTVLKFLKINLLSNWRGPYNKEWLKQWKYLSFLEIKLFVLSVEASQFSKFSFMKYPSI